MINADVNNFSNWAKFNLETRGYRFKDANKLLNKHKLFNLVSLKFNLTNYDLKRDSGLIIEYLSARFIRVDAEGWTDGKIGH